MSTQRQIERQARVARSSIIACASVFVAALSHVAAGGNSPTFFALIASTIAAVPLTLVLTHRRFGLTGMYVAVALAQALFHSLFVYIGTGTSGPSTPMPAHAEHFGMVQAYVPVIPGGAGPDLFMWISHAVAALVTVWLIRRGDTALARLAHVLTRVLWPTIRFLVRTPVRHIHHATPVHAAAAAVSRVGFAISHRGPPAGSAYIPR